MRVTAHACRFRHPVRRFYLYSLDAKDPITGHVFDVTSNPPPVAGAVPEPSIWAMMLLGFSGLGFMTYYRKRPMVTMTEHRSQHG